MAGWVYSNITPRLLYTWLLTTAMLAYQRKYQGQELLCVSNFYRKECVWKPCVALEGYRVLLSNYSDSVPQSEWQLRPYESVLLLKESH